MSFEQNHRYIVEEFVTVKRFCLWLRTELDVGIKLLLNETDRRIIILNCDLLIASPRPYHVADLMHNVIWPATNVSIEPRVMEMCSRAATVCCFFDSPEAEIIHKPITRQTL